MFCSTCGKFTHFIVFFLKHRQFSSALPFLHTTFFFTFYLSFLFGMCFFWLASHSTSICLFLSSNSCSAPHYLMVATMMMIIIINVNVRAILLFINSLNFFFCVLFWKWLQQEWSHNENPLSIHIQSTSNRNYTQKMNVIVDIIERVEQKFDGCADFIFTAFRKTQTLFPPFPSV